MSTTATTRMSTPLKSVRRVVARMPMWLISACEPVIAATPPIWSQSRVGADSVDRSTPSDGSIAPVMNR